MRAGAVLACAALAACGEPAPQPEAKTAIDLAEAMPGVPAEAVEAATGVRPNIAWPAEAPAFAPAYPGAIVDQAFAKDDEYGDREHVIRFRTPDPSDKVIAFYRASGKAAGLGEEETQTMPSGAHVQINDVPVDRVISLVTSRDRDETSVIMTASVPK